MALEVPFRRFDLAKILAMLSKLKASESSEVKEKCGDAAPEGFEECPHRVGPR